jgi:predicted transcriptional regulator
MTPADIDTLVLAVVCAEGPSSVSEIADDSGLTVRQVQLSLPRLRASGAVDMHGERSTAVYEARTPTAKKDP